LKGRRKRIGEMKMSKSAEEDELVGVARTLGTILKLVALPIMIVNAVLLEMPNTNLGISTVLLIVSTLMFFTGLVLSHLPKEKEEKGK
jgi:hypothetical protein